MNVVEDRFLRVAELTGEALESLKEFHAAQNEAERNRQDPQRVPFPHHFQNVVRALIRELDALIPRPAELQRILSAGEKLAGTLRNCQGWEVMEKAPLFAALTNLASVFTEPAESKPKRTLRPLEPIDFLLGQGVSKKQIGLIYGLTPGQLAEELATPGSVVGSPSWQDPRLADVEAEEQPAPFPVLAALAKLATEFTRDAEAAKPERPSIRDAWPSDPGAAERLAGCERAAVADLARARLRETEPALR